ncbi:MAG: TMEM143 family protein [Gemmataceae bacterium]
MPPRNDCLDFIAIHTPELIDLLVGEDAVLDEQGEQLRELADLIQRHYHRNLHQRLVELKYAYSPFDPDSDCAPLAHIPAQEKQTRLNDLLSDIIWVLNRAQFRHLSRQEFEPVLQNASEWGIRMQVDFSLFEHCAVFVRGEEFQTRKLRSVWTFFQEQDVDVPIYRRLVLLLKLRGDPGLGPTIREHHVYLKLFKEIPRADVDMLLPGARVRMNLMDRGKIGFGLVSGLATMVWKFFNDLWDFAHQILLTGSTAKMNVLWGLVAGSLGYGYKSYFDYRSTKTAYHLTLTQSLYFQNLDSNAGVLTRLFDEAEEQETRKTLLAYFCAWRFAGPQGMTAEEVEAAMGLFLDRYAGVSTLCTPGLPMATLLELGLVVQQGASFQAVDISEAIRRIRALRDQPAAPASRLVRRS